VLASLLPNTPIRWLTFNTNTATSLREPQAPSQCRSSIDPLLKGFLETSTSRPVLGTRRLSYIRFRE